MNTDDWKRLGLLDEADDQGGQNGGGSTAVEELHDDGQQSHDDGQQPPTQTPTAVPPLQISPEQFQTLLQTVQPQHQMQQPQMSQEDFQKAMRRFVVGQDHVNALFGEATTPELRAKTLQDIVDGAVFHALNLARAHNGLELEELRPQLNAVQQFQQERLREQFNTKIGSTYPTLKGKEAAVEMVVSHLKSQGYKSQGLEQDVRTVAAMTEALLKQANPAFSLTASQGQNGRQMPTMAGQRSGGSSGGGKPAKSTKVTSLWD